MTHLKAIAILCLITAVSSPVFADAKSDYEMLFGEEAKKVAATKTTADDVAFAEKLLGAAKAMTDAPATQTYLYEKAIEFASKDAAGAPHALKAIDLLVATGSGQGAKWQLVRFSIIEQQFQDSKGEARKQLAKPYLDALLVAAQIKAAAGKPSEAMNLYRKGVPVSIFATLIFVIVTVDHKINRWEGWFLLIFYLFFVGKLYGWV